MAARVDRLVRPDSLLPLSGCLDPHCQEESHRQERDSYVLDLMSAMIESSHMTIPLSAGKKNTSNADRSCHVENSVPGWRENVEPFKQDALFWHSVWKSAGSPSTGVLRDIMARTRNKYHYSIRKVKKESDDIRANKLLEAATTSDIELLKEMKKIRGSSKSGQTVPDSVDGVSGHEEIVDKFKEVYQELYNSAPTVDSMTNIKNTINNTISHDSTIEVNKITGCLLYTSPSPRD